MEINSVKRSGNDHTYTWQLTVQIVQVMTTPISGN